MAGSLDGTRVLDFGRWIAGPYCAHILASFGADVVRIERPKGEDDRFLMPVTAHGEGAQYLQCNGGKRSLTLDMTSPAGRGVMRRLIARADVVVANYSPGALKHFGLDYESLKSIKSDIILASASAYGSEGALAERIGFDGVGQAASGAVYLTGEPGKPYRAVHRTDRFFHFAVARLRNPRRDHRQDAHGRRRPCRSLTRRHCAQHHQPDPDGGSDRLAPSRTHGKPQPHVGPIRHLSRPRRLVHHAGDRPEGIPALV